MLIVQIPGIWISNLNTTMISLINSSIPFTFFGDGTNLDWTKFQCNEPPFYEEMLILSQSKSLLDIFT